MYSNSAVLNRPKRWPLVLALIVLFLVAAALGTGYAYSTNSAQQWRKTAESSANDLRFAVAEGENLKATVTELQTKSDDLQTQLDDVTNGFNSATDRIRSLADEKAQAGDSVAFLSEVLVMSQGVTTQMDTCISDLQKLQNYLVDYRSYDSQSLITYARGINDGCNQARQASSDLSKKLGG